MFIEKNRLSLLKNYSKVLIVMKPQIGDYYQIEKDNFDWVYAQVIESRGSDLTFQTVTSQETVCIPSGYQREIQVNSSIIDALGVKEGQFNQVYVLPTYHFFGNDFIGCCNPIYGFQVFPKEDYDRIANQLDALMRAAKKHYTHPVDLNYDKDEFIRKQLACIYNVNHLFKTLHQLGVNIIDKTEVLRQVENASVE